MTLTSEHIIHQLFKTAANYAKKAVDFDRANQFEQAVKFYLGAAEHLQKILELEKNEKMRDLYYNKALLYLTRVKEIREILKGPVEEETKIEELAEEMLPSVSDIVEEKPVAPISSDVQVDPQAQEISDLIYEAFDIKKQLKEKMKEYNIDDPITLKLALTELQDQEFEVHPTYEDYLSLQALEYYFKEILSKLDIFLAELKEKPVTEKADIVSIKERYNEFGNIITSEVSDILKEAPAIFVDRIEIVFKDNSHLKIYYPTDLEYSFFWSKGEEVFNVNAIVPNTTISPEITPKENIKNFLKEIRNKIAL
ncbi:MAG: hypothetical protein ACFFCD_14960 [Promethearchaeota archaeon]